MKKILLIDDTSDLSKYKSILKDEDLVEITSNIDKIFDISSQKPIYNNDYEFILLHQSFRGQEVPSDIIAIILKFVSDKMPYRLIRFTGGTFNTEGMVDEMQIDTYTTRKIIDRNILKFVSFSKQIEEWYLPALLLDNHLNYFLENAYNKLFVDFDSDLARKCLSVMGYESSLIDSISTGKLLELIENKINE
ncbi:hypothetical protein NMK71_04955 [Weeksellaceae bacterium KMM 9713]|uniref:Uncharacterized protein n=1 Tax=Profundicola chukchiensis TaxID=2961959 RepID=A0A9X4MZK7_9FLAO|nr:hypothetical protein [Profundicola chukchiensis]MDG4945755.1 hypothetical protein [Profundicola chukchiensis]